MSNRALQFPGCSYFAAHSMAEDAELVFCPYNYIINPIIREGLEVNMRGSIIILDEAQYVHSINGPYMLTFYGQHTFAQK